MGLPISGRYISATLMLKARRHRPSAAVQPKKRAVAGRERPRFAKAYNVWPLLSPSSSPTRTGRRQVAPAPMATRTRTQRKDVPDPTSGRRASEGLYRIRPFRDGGPDHPPERPGEYRDVSSSGPSTRTSSVHAAGSTPRWGSALAATAWAPPAACSKRMCRTARTQ